MSWYIWLIFAGIFLIFEIFTMGFLIFWLSIGALITMVVSFFVHDLIIQLTIFVVSSTILIFATKPLIKKFGLKDTVPTNVYSTIGKTAVVTQKIDNINGTGQIKLNGETWSALSDDENVVIDENSKVEVIRIKGVKAIVSKIN